MLKTKKLQVDLETLDKGKIISRPYNSITFLSLGYIFVLVYVIRTQHSDHNAGIETASLSISEYTELEILEKSGIKCNKRRNMNTLNLERLH